MRKYFTLALFQKIWKVLKIHLSNACVLDTVLSALCVLSFTPYKSAMRKDKTLWWFPFFTHRKLGWLDQLTRFLIKLKVHLGQESQCRMFGFVFSLLPSCHSGAFYSKGLSWQCVRGSLTLKRGPIPASAALGQKLMLGLDPLVMGPRTPRVNAMLYAILWAWEWERKRTLWQARRTDLVIFEPVWDSRSPSCRGMGFHGRRAKYCGFTSWHLGHCNPVEPNIITERMRIFIFSSYMS